MSLFVGPLRMKLQDACLNHHAGGSMSGIGQGDAFRRGLGRQDRRLIPINHFNAMLFLRCSMAVTSRGDELPSLSNRPAWTVCPSGNRASFEARPHEIESGPHSATGSLFFFTSAVKS